MDFICSSKLHRVFPTLILEFGLCSRKERESEKEREKDPSKRSKNQGQTSWGLKHFLHHG